MPGFQSPITIHQAIERINKNQFLLPAFQREFVWKIGQIEQLFDSLMQGYPISSMLFWKVEENTKADFRFYQFLKKYIEYHQVHNDTIATNGVNDFHAILDGQQRLTALYIGLCGSFAYKEYRRAYAYSEWSYPTRHLYFNISSLYTEEESDKKYKFTFLDKSVTQEQEIYIDSLNEKWMRTGVVLDLYKNDGLDDFSDKYSLSKESKKLIKRLERVIHTESTINYYEEDEQNPDKAVNIFVRINSGGTYLSFSDILMSIAIASWKQKDARTEINDLVDNIRAKGFNIDKDYILKSFLYLHHKDVRFRITSFKNDFIGNIELNWEKIRNSILNLFDLIKTFGLNNYTLTTNNATLPILYYIYHKNIYADFSTKTAYKEDREIIKKWLLTILVRRTFGGQTDTVLTQSRKAFTPDIEISTIGNIVLFPTTEINKEIKKVTDIGDDYIEELLLTQKDSQYSFPILALLYPNMDYKNNNFHQDHLHPAASYEDITEEEKKNFGWGVYNSIINLQMLDANENMSKNAMSLKDWVNKETKDSDLKRFMDSHLIPQSISLELSNFTQFITNRKILLASKLKSILNFDNFPSVIKEQVIETNGESGNESIVSQIPTQTLEHNNGNQQLNNPTKDFIKVRNKDYSDYFFNGQKFNKRRLVLAVLKDYVEKNPSITYNQLKSLFPDSLQGQETFTTENIAKQKKDERNFIKPEEIISLADERIAVNSQWGIFNIPEFIEHCKKMNIIIQS